MDSPSITLQRAGVEELDHIETLLEANGLPTRDVRAKPECFFVACDEGTVVGVGGLEHDGSDGLLRSLVVTESVRGRGYGTTLCAALESRARSEGIEALYLLTTTAASFFRERGYDEITREETPVSIQGTAEFSELCPDSATCLRKDLG